MNTPEHTLALQMDKLKFKMTNPAGYIQKPLHAQQSTDLAVLTSDISKQEAAGKIIYGCREN